MNRLLAFFRDKPAPPSLFVRGLIASIRDHSHRWRRNGQAWRHEGPYLAIYEPTPFRATVTIHDSDLPQLTDDELSALTNAVRQYLMEPQAVLDAEAARARAAKLIAPFEALASQP